ncbi:MAG: sulfatase [Deltaproteobacteria bacterium]|nr:sulfatase [Deltaproteobacteria bacterium]
MGATALSLLAPGLAFASQDRHARPPNIILLFADDLGYCDTGLYGCDRVPTPHINSIARDGVLFTDGYVTAPVCSPSRAGLLTGRYQQRFGCEFNVGPIRRALRYGVGLPASEITLAHILKKAGYTTGVIGKWHVGAQPQYHPFKRGFDEFFGFIAGQNYYLDPQTPDAQSIFILWRDGQPGFARFRQIDPIRRGRDPVEEKEYLTDAFTREAIDYIERHKAEPFFLYLSYNAPHTPLQATRKYYDRFPHIKDERWRIYAAMISAVDDSVGAILGKLKETNLEDNTLIFFLSDNGCALYTQACDNKPLRLGKMYLLDGGTRVPFAMKWPGQVPAGKVYQHPVSSLDVFPTAAAAARVDVPKDRKIDGVNLVPYLRGDKTSPAHDTLFWRNGSLWAVRSGYWKLFQGACHYWLYNVSQDIGEQKNLASQNPGVVKQLQEAFLSWNAGLKDPLWPSRRRIPFQYEGVRLEIQV